MTCCGPWTLPSLTADQLDHCETGTPPRPVRVWSRPNGLTDLVTIGASPIPILALDVVVGASGSTARPRAVGTHRLRDPGACVAITPASTMMKSWDVPPPRRPRMLSPSTSSAACRHGPRPERPWYCTSGTARRARPREPRMRTRPRWTGVI